MVSSVFERDLSTKTRLGALVSSVPVNSRARKSDVPKKKILASPSFFLGFFAFSGESKLTKPRIPRRLCQALLAHYCRLPPSRISCSDGDFTDPQGDLS